MTETLKDFHMVIGGSLDLLLLGFPAYGAGAVLAAATWLVKNGALLGLLPWRAITLGFRLHLCLCRTAASPCTQTDQLSVKSTSGSSERHGKCTIKLNRDTGDAACKKEGKALAAPCNAPSMKL